MSGDFTWVKIHKEVKARKALAASPGLRSVGFLVVNEIVRCLKSELVAEIFSAHFPVIYQSMPSYSPQPELPGIGGCIIDEGVVRLPSVKIFWCSEAGLLVVVGYHANFNGQYEVARKVLDLLKSMGVEELYVLAAHAKHEGGEICCAAVASDLLEVFKGKTGLQPCSTGPFLGFSGLLFGLAQSYKMKAVALFSKTEPDYDNPEIPDPRAAIRLLDFLNKVFGLAVKPSKELVEAAKAIEAERRPKGLTYF
ncbi:MAG TPA: hypothetical protein ENF82_01400 [Candidatus Methanomethylia archaeon]|nr:hypothetical protein [Candidatus Methanomethylicia archaeon]